MEAWRSNGKAVCIGRSRLLEGFAEDTWGDIRIEYLDPAQCRAECLEQNALFFIFDPSEEQWAALSRHWISRIVMYVVNGGTLLAFRGAFENARYWEIVQMLGAGTAFSMPYGEMRLDLVRTAASEGIRNTEYTLFSEAVIPRQDVFASLQTLVGFQYGATCYPAVWQRTWGKGNVFCTTLKGKDFCTQTAGEMLQAVLKSYLEETALERPRGSGVEKRL